MGVASVTPPEASRKPAKSSFVIVTTAQAVKWLEANTHNRPVRDAVVKRYAAMMREGQWKKTHQGIAFDWNGTLIDGQHRLWAVIESATDVEMLVTTGLDPDAQFPIDMGLVRGLTDQLSLKEGHHLDRRIVPVARAMMGSISQLKEPGANIYHVEAFIVQHRQAIDFALRIFPSWIKGIVTAPMVAAVARASYHHPHERLEQFAHVLSKGVMGEPGDVAAILLREWMVRGESAKGTSRAAQVYAKSERALMAFAMRDTLTQLYAATSELFLLPGEQRRGAAPRSHRAAKPAGVKK